MNETDLPTENPAGAGAGFQISSEPIVGAARPPEPAPVPLPAADLGELPGYYGTDLLYAVARDPNSLFLYWDLDWKGLFSAADLSPREIHLRILRQDGTEESTIEIDPFICYCFAEVTDAGASYSCELGCFADADWKPLIRSSVTATPNAAMSDDLDADFATLPFHLSFQRLIDIFRAPTAQRGTLAKSVAAMQGKTRALRQTMPASDWSKLVEAAANLVDAEAAFGLTGVSSSDFATFLQAEQRNEKNIAPSHEMRERWRELGERFGGSSWGGGGGFGGSSRA
jgi:hypothetical protein